MPMPLTQEIRKKIVFHKENGESNVDIARWLLINEKSVRRVWKQYKEENTIEPRALNRGRKPAFGQEVMDKIVDRIIEQPDITLEELIAEFDLKISVSALCRKLKKLKLKRKKNVISKRAEAGRHTATS